MKDRDNKEKNSWYKFILIFVLLTLGIVAAGYFYYRNYESKYRIEVERQISAVSKLKASELAQWRKERLDGGSIFYKNAAFSALVGRYFENPEEPEAKGQLRAWLSRVGATNEYDRVRLLDTQGVMRMESPAGLKPISPVVLQGISETLQSGQVTFVDFYRNDHDQRVYLTVLIPIIDGKSSRRALGILALRIDPEKYLYPHLQGWPTLSQTAETLLVRRDGKDVQFLNELRFKNNTALNLRVSLEKGEEMPAVKAVLGYEGIVKGVDYRGVSVIADVRAVPGSPWFLVARMDISEVYGPLGERFWMMVAMVAALVIGSGAGVGMVWRQQRMRFYKVQYEAVEKLRALSTRQEAILAAVPDIIMEVDNNKVYTWANPPGMEFFGQDVIGKEAAFYFEGKQDTYQKVQPVFNGDGNLIYVESWQRRRDGQRRLLAWWCRTLKDERGNVTGALSSARDITERRQAEEEIRRLNTELEQRVVERTALLEVANKELEAFAYSVSHDLRSPLRAIEGFSHILLEDYADRLDAEGQRLLKVVRTNTQTMDRLITGLLTLSRVTRGDIQFSRIDMTTLAHSIYHEIATPEVQQKHVFSVAPLPEANGDPNLMRQVWSNLISNAIKYSMPKNDVRIEIGGYMEKEMNIYYVKDNGVGFNPDYTHKLFGVFQRLHKAEEFEGTGVGLAIAQRIVHRHGGRTWAEGKINQGATVYFSIPKSE